jgi:hypothetical protein
VIDALARSLSVSSPQERVYEVPLHSVRLGMRFAEDVRTHTGILLIAKGFEVNLALLERIRHVSPESVGGTVRITLPARIAEQVAGEIAIDSDAAERDLEEPHDRRDADAA